VQCKRVFYTVEVSRRIIEAMEDTCGELSVPENGQIVDSLHIYTTQNKLCKIVTALQVEYGCPIVTYI
jgi:hypothetical protein